MLLKFQMLLNNLVIAFLLMLVLCIGVQNPKDEKVLNLGVTTTVPLPASFFIGISCVFGVLSGSSTAALFLPSKRD